MSTVSTEQYAFLTLPVDPKRVQHLRGQSHMEAWDIRRTLIRAFGFGGFDIETKHLELVREIVSEPGTIKYANGGTNERTVYTVVYRAEVRMIIKAADGTVLAVYEDGAAGDATNHPSLGDAHDQAMKTSLSQGLKRCAVNLGDQFGLSLYNDGKIDAVVHRTLNAPAGQTAAPTDMPVDEVRPEPKPATEPDPPPEQPVEVSRSAALSNAIAECTSREQLTAVWKQMVAADKAGDVTPQASEVLKKQWKARDLHIKAIAKMFVLLGKAEIGDRDQRIAWYVQIIGREVASTTELTTEEIDKISVKTEAWIGQNEPVGAAR